MNTTLLATQEGIKTVGVGRKGSRPLDGDLIRRIRAEWQAGEVPDSVKGAFLAGLIMKGPTPEERSLEDCFQGASLDDPLAVTAYLAAGAPDAIRDICRRLLSKQELSLDEAQQLGIYLFGPEAPEALCGLVASLLRVRYETPDEYEGLLGSMTHTFRPEFRRPVPDGRPVVAVADPFDGASRTYGITPLVMRRLQALGHRVVGLCGRNSGPKYGHNLKDLAAGLNARFLKANAELTNEPQPFGWYLDQADLSPALDRWVDIRRLIIKRPFLATLERFVDPCRAAVMIGSAFHPPYGDKMLTICERAGFPAAIIVRNGMEGSIAFPLLRQARVLGSVRTKQGDYLRQEFIFDPKDMLPSLPAVEERRELPDIAENIRLIREFAEHGRTTEPLFDDRVRTTAAGLERVLGWIRSHQEGESDHVMD